MEFWTWWSGIAWLQWFTQFGQLATGIAWPTAAVLCVLIFRSHIASLLGRLVRVGKEGAEFGPPEQKTIARPPEQPALLVAPRRDMLPVFQPLAAKIEHLVRANLPQVEQSTGRSREDILIDGYVNVQGALLLERAYHQIFGSQIRALEFLIASGGRSTKQLIKQFYDQGASEFPAVYQHYSFDQWLLFLLNFQLIQTDGESIALTPEGQAFVPYVATQSYSLRKPG